jgi:hypothetical protein
VPIADDDAHLLDVTIWPAAPVRNRYSTHLKCGMQCTSSQRINSVTAVMAVAMLPGSISLVLVSRSIYGGDQLVPAYTHATPAISPVPSWSLPGITPLSSQAASSHHSVTFQRTTRNIHMLDVSCCSQVYSLFLSRAWIQPPAEVHSTSMRVESCSKPRRTHKLVRQAAWLPSSCLDLLPHHSA